MTYDPLFLKLRAVWNSGRVIRNHTFSVLNRQNLADHQWGVAQIALELFGESGVSKALLIACLRHDMGEVAVGDNPYPIKKQWPELRAIVEEAEKVYLSENDIDYPALTEREKSQLGCADMAEFLMYCIKEIEMGNISQGQSFENAYASLDKFAKSNPQFISQYPYIQVFLDDLRTWSKSFLLQWHNIPKDPANELP